MEVSLRTGISCTPARRNVVADYHGLMSRVVPNLFDNEVDRQTAE